MGFHVSCRGHEGQEWLTVCRFYLRSVSIRVKFPVESYNVRRSVYLCLHYDSGRADIDTVMSPESPLERLKALKFSYLYLSEVAESSQFLDKMKVVFSRSRSEDESFVGLMRDLCFSLRISLSKKRRLVTELEALGEQGDAAKALEHIRDIVARDDVTLGE
ncbi:hypothetical protein Tco_0735640 [Tanacetum coccineum]